MNKRHRLIFTWIVVVSGLAWIGLYFYDRSLIVSVFCGPQKWQGWAEAVFVLKLNGPLNILVSYVLMVMAMMSPLLYDPLKSVADRSLKQFRIPAMIIFCLGYLSIWILAAPLLWFASVYLQLITVKNVVSPAILLAIIFILWHMTPWRQLWLNRCHRRLLVSGNPLQGARLSIVYGIYIGATCLAICAPLMLLTMSISQGHLLAMMIASFGLTVERQLPPVQANWGPRNIQYSVRKITYWSLQFLKRKWQTISKFHLVVIND